MTAGLGKACHGRPARARSWPGWPCHKRLRRSLPAVRADSERRYSQL